MRINGTFVIVVGEGFLRIEFASVSHPASTLESAWRELVSRPPVNYTIAGPEARKEGSVRLVAETVGELVEHYEAVNHPPHYGGADNPYEAIKVIEAWDLGFCDGNAVKYICRQGKKTTTRLEDLKKARWYLDRLIERLEAPVGGAAAAGFEASK